VTLRGLSLVTRLRGKAGLEALDSRWRSFLPAKAK
jgi:hypothetical protein